MSNEDNAKGGALTGGALTDEVIESSETVLQQQGASQKGLQQFFSPPEMSELAHRMFEGLPVIDLTAGDGSLLQAFPKALRYGIEIDADQIGNSRGDKEYLAVHGDVQQVAPILHEVQAKFEAVVLNPPYGLKWTDPTIRDGEPTNSAIVAFEYGARLLAYRGQMLMLSGGDSKFENIAEHLTYVDPDRASSVVPYAVLHVADMFDNVQSRTDVTFFGWIGSHEPQPDVLHIETTRDALTSPELLEQLRTARNITNHRGWAIHQDNKLKLQMKAAQQEHDRRRGEKPKRKSDFDIYGERKRIRVQLRPYTALKLAHTRAYDHVRSFDRQPLEYFVLNHKAWDGLLTMCEQETITIEPHLIDRVRVLINERERDTAPMYDLNPQQRLAWLEDLDKVLCTSSDPDKEFVEGEEYPISVQTVIRQDRERGRPVVNQKTGDITLKDYLQERKVLQIRIKGRTFTESKTDIEYIIAHFSVPEAPTIAERYPEEVEAARQMLHRYEVGQSWKYKPFQLEDIARLVVKGRGLLAWEQGLGKTLAGLSFAKARVEMGAEDKVLFVVPQDLIPQWRREAKRFFDIDLKWLKTQNDVIRCRRHLRNGGTGWYVTHYEALSRSGRISEDYEPGARKWKAVIEEQTTGGDYYHDDSGQLRRTPIQKEMVRRIITDATNCPRCGTSYRNGYNPNGRCYGKLPKSNTECGHMPYTRRVKGGADLLKSVFRHGVMVIDELTMIKGDYAQRSKAIRGIKAAHILGMTGTPIKNYIPDSFWGLWKTIGDSTPGFPYAYDGGKTKYENDFAVVEHQLGGGWRRENRKVLPEVTNLSRLWRLLSGSCIRRRKEECGEPLVKRTFYPTHVPLGVKQRAAAERWLQSFGTYFKLKNPDHPVVQKNMEEVMAALLGQLAKLEYAATLPKADPDELFWTAGGECEQLCEAQGVPYPKQWEIAEPSNWTPANVRVLELAMHHAAQGSRILIGSDLVLPGEFLTEELSKRGVKVGNTLTGGDGSPPKTKSPAARAKIVQAFQDGKIDVLISTCAALNLGHNLDKGDVVIVNGLPWDFATFDQFLARIHRLTSKKDVRVYVIVPRGTLSERKWKLLVDKGAASMLALDGRLIEQDEEQIDQATILKQLIAAGVPVTGTEVDEDELERRWQNIKSADDLGDIVLEGAGVEDLAELQEPEDEPDVETEELADPDSQAEVEPEPDPAESGFLECYQCGGHIYGKPYVTDSDGDHYCSYECAERCWDDPDIERFGGILPVKADEPEAEAKAVPSHDHDYPIGPLTKPFDPNEHDTRGENPATIVIDEVVDELPTEEELADDVEPNEPEVEEPTVQELVNAAEMANLREPDPEPQPKVEVPTIDPAPAGGLGLF